MNDYDRDAPAPAAEDPAIHGQLTALRPFGPSGSFQDRVMSRVWRPLPPRLRRMRERYDEWVRSGRVWLAVGGLAAGSLIPLGIAVGLSVTFWDPIASFGGGVLADVVPNAWAGVTAQAREGFDAAYAAVTAVLPSGAALLAASAATVLVLAGCAWGLYRTVGGPSAVRGASHATR